MKAELHDAGMCRTENGARIRLRMPLRPRAPRYRCPGCDCEVTSNVVAEEPGIYGTQCTGCGLVTRVVVELKFFLVTS